MRTKKEMSNGCLVVIQKYLIGLRVLCSVMCNIIMTVMCNVMCNGLCNVLYNLMCNVYFFCFVLGSFHFFDYS